jgi:hypothetical protein
MCNVVGTQIGVVNNSGCDFATTYSQNPQKIESLPLA